MEPHREPHRMGPDARDSWPEAIRLGLKIAVAHHPLCSWFRDDRYQIGSTGVCRGCAAAVPGLLVGLMAAVLFLHVRPHDVLLMAATGLVLGVPHGTTYLHRFSKTYRAGAKFFGGLGLGLFMVGVLFFPIPLAFRLAILGVLGLCFVALQMVRVRRMLSVCDACAWRRDWARCPGFVA